jgi:basic membrane protein A
MKKILVSLFVLVLSATVLCACKAKTYEIALVTDVGNIDDKSFNESAWIGVKGYAEENDITFAYYRPTADTTPARLQAIKNAVDKGAKVIVCPGYLFKEALYEAQTLYPEVAFILLDAEPAKVIDEEEQVLVEDNVYCILYKEEQVGYLAGYAAVKEGYRKLGFLGGMAVPAVVRYGYGFVQGAEAAAVELQLAVGAVTIEHAYAGVFYPTDEIKTKMDGWYTAGTEVVFACGGGIYLSVITAAEAAGSTQKIIGVDRDQSYESTRIITSAMKDITNSVLLALGSFYDNDMAWDTAHAGVTASLGAAEECVGLATGASWRLTNFTVAQYETLLGQMIAGTVTINSSHTVAPTVTKVTVNYDEDPIVVPAE